MKILFFTPYFRPYIGGIERFVDEVSTRLLDYKDVEDVFIITTNSIYKKGIQKNFKQFEISKGRKIYRLDFHPRDIPGLYHSYNAGFFSKDLKSLIYSIKPNITHFCKFEWFIPNLNTIKYSLNFSEKQIFFVSYHPKKILLKHLPMILCNRVIFRSIDFAHVPSIYIKSEIAELLNFPKSRILNIPLGANFPIKKQINHKYINIINVGRFNERKGQYNLVKLFLSLPEPIRLLCKLTLIGNDDGDLNNVKSIIDCEPNVRILENLNDSQLENEFLKGDIYATMSKDEVFGISLFEAMSHGLAVIAFRTFGNALLSNDKNSAIIIDNESISSFKNELTRLIMNHSYREKIGSNAKKLIREEFNWEKTTKRILDLYTQ